MVIGASELSKNVQYGVHVPNLGSKRPPQGPKAPVNAPRETGQKHIFTSQKAWLQHMDHRSGPQNVNRGCAALPLHRYTRVVWSMANMDRFAKKYHFSGFLRQIGQLEAPPGHNRATWPFTDQLETVRALDLPAGGTLAKRRPLCADGDYEKTARVDGCYWRNASGDCAQKGILLLAVFSQSPSTHRGRHLARVPPAGKSRARTVSSWPFGLLGLNRCKSSAL